MGFPDHAEALRGVLLRMAAVIVVLTVGLFAAMPHIFDSVIPLRVGATSFSTGGLTAFLRLH